MASTTPRRSPSLQTQRPSDVHAPVVLDIQFLYVMDRLVLLLANHIGDLRVLREAIAAARAGVVQPVENQA